MLKLSVTQIAASILEEFAGAGRAAVGSSGFGRALPASFVKIIYLKWNPQIPSAAFPTGTITLNEGFYLVSCRYSFQFVVDILMRWLLTTTDWIERGNRADLW